jgi:pyruvate/2-oxoglutarate dehydrogenase complex dihydrolipoamide dehydrogenase (E3) component
MNAEKFDVVIVRRRQCRLGVTGLGPARGLSVGKIEARDLGGTCPNRGCTPKKVLVAAGQALHDIERAAQHRCGRRAAAGSYCARKRYHQGHTGRASRAPWLAARSR